MNELEHIIAERIRRDGPITFETFMDMALYYPGLGYYARESIPIGGREDFVTSPHMHPIFGALLGRQVVEMWELMGKPKRFDIVETGGGKGHLSCDLLDSLKNHGIYAAISYTLIERNPTLKEEQRTLLLAHREKVRWAESSSELEGLRGLVLSNELFDAMPVHLMIAESGLKEIFVNTGPNGFEEERGPLASESLVEYLDEFAPDLPDGYLTEVNLRMRHWLQEVSAVLHEGFMLTIDYGYPASEYYAPERNRGTLLCYYQQEVSENPFELVGQKDMTAHVNFSALKKWGEELGLRSLGFTRQGPYLVSLGIDELIAEIYDESSDFSREMAKIKSLVMPGAMGDTHRVLIQHKGSGNPVMRGFQFKNDLRCL